MPQLFLGVLVSVEGWNGGSYFVTMRSQGNMARAGDIPSYPSSEPSLGDRGWEEA